MTDREPDRIRQRRPALRVDEAPSLTLTLRGAVRIVRDNGRVIEGEMEVEWDDRDLKALARALEHVKDLEG